MNEAVFLFLNQFQNGSAFTNTLIFVLADILILSFLIALYFYIITADNHRQAIKNSTLIVLSGLLAWAFADLIKYIFPHDRPFVALDSINVLFERGGTNSFPSGHTAFISSVATMFYFYNKKIGVGMFFVVLLVGVGRVMSGMHWPSDILGGVILGGVVAFSIFHIYRVYQKYYSWSERLKFWK